MYSFYSVLPRALPLGALLPLCSAVLALVSVSAARLRESLPAHTTLVWFLSRVRQFVFLQTGHLGKPLGAALKLASIRSLSRVCSYVVLEIPCGSEGFPTALILADERPLASVHPPMHVEVLRSVEALAAAWKLALARSIGYVDLLDV